MRISIIAVCLVFTGCSQPGPTTPLTKAIQEETGLYTDAQISSLSPIDVDKLHPDDEPFDLPCLNVVPNGESKPIGRIFAELGLVEARCKDFRSEGIGKVTFITWQVSPSYDLSLMTANNSPMNSGLTLTNPQRHAYGVRIMKRSK